MADSTSNLVQESIIFAKWVRSTSNPHPFRPLNTNLWMPRSKNGGKPPQMGPERAFLPIFGIFHVLPPFLRGEAASM